MRKGKGIAMDYEESGVYGRMVPDSETPKVTVLREDTCPNCHSKRILYSRKFSHAEYVVHICDYCNHAESLEATYFGKYHAGDRIRKYATTFEKNSRLILDTYKEGTVTKVYVDSVFGYLLDFRVEEEFIGGKEVPSTSWIIGSERTGIQHKEWWLELIEKNLDDNSELVTVFDDGLIHLDYPKKMEYKPVTADSDALGILIE